jgi:hypothetical protein
MYEYLTKNPNNYFLCKELIKENNEEIILNNIKKEFININLNNNDIEDLIFNLIKVNPKDRINMKVTINILENCLKKLNMSYENIISIYKYKRMCKYNYFNNNINS